MSAKENFSKAMFDMFGVGGERDDVAKEEAVETLAVETADVVESVADLPAENTVVENKAYVYQKPDPAAPVAGQTYLAPDTVLEGTLRTKGDVTIAGTFKGDIFSEGNVMLSTSVTGNVSARSMTLLGCSLTGECTTTETTVIRENSSLRGNIKAKEVLCSGTVNGDIVVSDHVKLASTACVTGNITAGSLSVESGAVIKGKLAITSNAE